jgi:hypothetical protein
MSFRDFLKNPFEKKADVVSDDAPTEAVYFEEDGTDPSMRPVPAPAGYHWDIQEYYSTTRGMKEFVLVLQTDKNIRKWADVGIHRWAWVTPKDIKKVSQEILDDNKILVKHAAEKAGIDLNTFRRKAGLS